MEEERKRKEWHDELRAVEAMFLGTLKALAEEVRSYVMHWTLRDAIWAWKVNAKHCWQAGQLYLECDWGDRFTKFHGRRAGGPKGTPPGPDIYQIPQQFINSSKFGDSAGGDELNAGAAMKLTPGL